MLVFIRRADFFKWHARMVLMLYFILYPDQVYSVLNYTFGVLGFFLFYFLHFLLVLQNLLASKINLDSAMPPSTC